MIADILQDAFFASLAAIGFAAISRPPRQAYLWCALIAAVAHSLRTSLMAPDLGGMNIIGASFCASFVVGLMSVFISPLARMPAETCLYPSLLPMIPGVYAYKSVAGLAMCILTNNAADFDHYFFLFSQNGLTCLCILLGMVIGATAPILLFKRISFQATR